MKRGTPDHPKFLKLCQVLRLQKYEAAGLLEMLWHFTAKWAPQGDIGKYPDSAIAEAVGWKRPTGAKGVTPECRLSDALVDAEWLDRDTVHRLLVHDWPDHADQSVKRMLASRGLAFIQPTASLPVPLPVPLPEPDPIAVLADGKTPAPPAPPPTRGLADEDGFPEFREAAEAAGMSGSDVDWQEARSFEWRKLSFEQHLAATFGIRERAEKSPDDPALRALPKNYLGKRMWERRINTSTGRRMRSLVEEMG